MKEIRKIKIGNTEVYLENFEYGKGKVTITDYYYGAFSYSWGAMGSTIEEFICRIDEYYWAKNLCPNSMIFSASASVRAIRRHIKEGMNYELPWYKYMEGQKEMREKLKELEGCENEYEFIHGCESLADNLMCLDMDYDEEKEFKDILRSFLNCEPWHFIEREYSDKTRWCLKLHGKLKKELEKILQIDEN